MTLNGQQIGRQNVEKLRAYLEANRDTLPLFNGKLNKSRIARDAGLDRQVFESNPACAELLTQYGDASRAPRAPMDAGDPAVAEKVRRLEAEVFKYRELAAKRSIEIEKRRKESLEDKARLMVFETMMATMRKPPMPPITEGP